MERSQQSLRKASMVRGRAWRSLAVGVMAFMVGLTAPQLAEAQYLGHNFHGDFGVNSGSQAGPGFYFAVPFAQWNADNINDADGNAFAASRFQGVDIRVVRATRPHELAAIKRR